MVVEIVGTNGIVRRLWEIDGDVFRLALVHNGGDIKKTAAALNVSRKTVHSKINSHEIDIEQIRKDAQR